MQEKKENKYLDVSISINKGLTASMVLNNELNPVKNNSCRC